MSVDSPSSTPSDSPARIYPGPSPGLSHHMKRLMTSLTQSSGMSLSPSLSLMGKEMRDNNDKEEIIDDIGDVSGAACGAACGVNSCGATDLFSSASSHFLDSLTNRLVAPSSLCTPSVDVNCQSMTSHYDRTAMSSNLSLNLSPKVKGDVTPLMRSRLCFNDDNTPDSVITPHSPTLPSRDCHYPSTPPSNLTPPPSNLTPPPALTPPSNLTPPTALRSLSFGEEAYSPAVPKERRPSAHSLTKGPNHLKTRPKPSEEFDLSPLPPLMTTGRHRRFRPLNSSPDRRGGKRMCAVKKTLFNSPVKSPQRSSLQPLKPQAAKNLSFGDEEKPLASTSFKRMSPNATPEVDSSPLEEFCCKKRKTSATTNGSDGASATKVWRSSACHHEQMVNLALDQDQQDSNLVGDFTRSCRLPTSKVNQQSDLRYVTPDTVHDLLQGRYSSEVSQYIIIDCRYPYEYDGGHIKGADNIFTRSSLQERFMSSPSKRDTNRTVVLFHCEFSSQRAPALLRYLRGEDRRVNYERYPLLYYPELYILEGGYKAFFELYPSMCCPSGYKTMADANHIEDLKYYKALANQITRKRTPAFKANLKF